METTLDLMRRQARLLSTLLDQAQRAAAEGEWDGAETALVVFAERLQQRIELSEGSVFPWIERRVNDPHFLPNARLRVQHGSLVRRTQATLAAIGDRRFDAATASLTWLRTLFEAHLDEEEQVLWPLFAAQLRA